MSEDNWKHKSIKMKCQTCMWFMLKQQNATDVEVTEMPRLGRCRRRAPTMNGFPVVYENDWCGDHKLDENKIL